MIEKEDILKLATLARLSVTDEQAQKLVTDMDSILGYVKQISDVDILDTSLSSEYINVVREDIATEIPEQYTDNIIDEMPDHEGRYLRVKKILEGK